MIRRGHWAMLCLAIASITIWLGFGTDNGPRADEQPELMSGRLVAPRLDQHEPVRQREDRPSLMDGSEEVSVEYRTASSQLPPAPPGSDVVEFDVQTENGLRETVVKLESDMLPVELASFYAEELIDDWLVYRDTLSGSIGWNGVFLQLGEVERRMGIFVTSRGWNDLRTQPVGTRISIIMVEEI